MNTNENLLDDMCRLRDFLLNSKICPDIGPLSRLISKLQANINSGAEENFEYSLDDLVFNLCEKCGTICPTQITPKESPIEIHLELILKSEGPYEFSKIKELSGQLRLKAEWLNDRTPDAELKTSHSAWHFDYHVSKKGDGANLFSHPQFHLQNGGNKLTDNLNDYGELMILDAPRLPLPPMDVILAIDFIISNFFGLTWQKALCDSEYIDVVKRAQEAWWKPYYEGISQHWSGNGSGISNALIPSLL
ncbi:hypothetical protein [Pantoea cypripedii]|uniref:Uncharacterized protein n=1 Tax=Pantoea cypripedii TaxID=55209 RepID=A0A1X1EYF6_PANCY|nr:hypothetical protein [Pantoea cypripedii]MBP2195102.1 hypothetical protein [Pantoea cypripedii]ORM94944.1 hypothetical protein HA50_16965 [Pantoea cypripedii]